MKIFNLISRILIGLFFLAIGLFHFYGYQTMAYYVPLPFGSKIFVLLVGVLISMGAIGILLNKFLRISLIGIACTLAFTGLMVLTPMIFRNPDELSKMLELQAIYKLILAFILFIISVSVKTKYPVAGLLGMALSLISLIDLTPLLLREPDELMKMIELPNLYKLVLAYGVFCYLSVTEFTH